VFDGVVAPITGIVGLLVLGSPFSEAAQQFQSEGGETEEKIQFFSPVDPLSDRG
tara:strand:- start:87 stop:248 length:162 start_codon:yes stop_codon:yes gene_type:complete